LHRNCNCKDCNDGIYLQFADLLCFLKKVVDDIDKFINHIGIYLN